jgi:hypothetical protein
LASASSGCAFDNAALGMADAARQAVLGQTVALQLSGLGRR